MGHPRLREHKQLPCQLPGGRVPSPLFLRIFFALHTTAAELVSCRHDGRGDPAIEHVKKVASHLWMFRAKDLGFAATAVWWLRLVTAREVAPPKPWRPLLKAREIAVGCIFSAPKGPLQAPLRCPSAQRGRQTLGPPCTPRPCTLCPSGATYCQRCMHAGRGAHTPARATVVVAHKSRRPCSALAAAQRTARTPPIPKTSVTFGRPHHLGNPPTHPHPPIHTHHCCSCVTLPLTPPSHQHHGVCGHVSGAAARGALAGDLLPSPGCCGSAGGHDGGPPDSTVVGGARHVGRAARSELPCTSLERRGGTHWSGNELDEHVGSYSSS